MTTRVTFQPSRMGRARQVLHWLTPTYGLTTAGNILAGKKVTVTVERTGLFIRGKKAAHTRHLAGRLYCHGVKQFELDGATEYDLKATFRSIIHRNSVESTARKVVRFDMDIKLEGFGADQEEACRSAQRNELTKLANLIRTRMRDANIFEKERLENTLGMVVAHERTPRSVLLEIAKDYYPGGTAEAAYERLKESLTPDELIELAATPRHDGGKGLIKKIFAHPNTPVDKAKKRMLEILQEGAPNYNDHAVAQALKIVFPVDKEVTEAVASFWERERSNWTDDDDRYTWLR